jgi:death-on-curing protein
MKEPRWITATAIHAIHEELLARFGGLSGFRDEGMLDSALGRPKNSFAYGEPSQYELAADYAGFMAAYVFLMANGQDFNATEETVVLQTLALAAGEISGAEYAMWLEQSCD